MRWIGMSLLSLVRGAIWGGLTALIGSAVFWGFFLLPIASDDAYYPEALVFSSLILTMTPASILGVISGMALGLLIRLDETIGSSIFASVSAGGIVGLATTSLIVAAYLFGLRFGMDYLPLGLCAMVIGTIAGSITGWRLSVE
jgi:hypothetical protein